MWLHHRLLFSQFSTLLKSDPIMLFASYPVGFPMLKKLHSHYANIGVVTHYTRPNQKKTNQVEVYCRKEGIPCYFPVKKEGVKEEREKEWGGFVEEVGKSERKYKLGIVCAYGYMIPENVIKLFEKGMILAHPSLIPKYRGGSPIFHAIANGQKQSGISVMEISASKFDQGNLLYQVKHPLGEKDAYEKVEKQLSELMAEEIVGVIEKLDQLRPGKVQSQMDISGIPPHQLQARIHKQKSLDIHAPAQQVYNWSRALITPRVKFNNTEIIPFFDKVFLEDPHNNFKPGQLILKGKNLYMRCGDKFLKVVAWQQLTKKQLPVHTFVDRFIGDRGKYGNDLFFK